MSYTCPLCQSQKIKKLFLDQFKLSGQFKAIQYYHCSHCDLVFQDPLARPTSEMEKQRYDQHNNDVADKAYIKYMEGSWEFAFQSAPCHVHQMLDFGCGPSSGIKWFGDKNNIITQRYDPYFYKDEQALLERYELIFCIEAVEHFYNPIKELELLYGCLKKEGQLIIRTGILEDKSKFPNWWYHRDPTHVCFFSANTLHWVKQHFGFSTIEIQGDLVRLVK